MKYFLWQIRNSLFIMLLSSLPMTTFASYIVHGVKFLDTNNNGQFDVDSHQEPGFKDQTIYIEEEVVDDSLPPLHTVTTDINGNYSLEVSAVSSGPKKFKMWSNIPPNLIQTSPVRGTGLQIHEITLSPGEPQEVNFGVYSLDILSAQDQSTCNNPQVESQASGGWTPRDPRQEDVAVIHSNHTIRTNYVLAKTLCIEDGGLLIGDNGNLLLRISRSGVEGGDIYNNGQIIGAAGNHNYWNCSSDCNLATNWQYVPATSGKNVTIEATLLANTGIIQGGIAGQAITHGQIVDLNFTNDPYNWQSIAVQAPADDLARSLGLKADAVGGKGGDVNITVQTGINDGFIGSFGKHTYHNGKLSSSGSNGGTASLSSSYEGSCDPNQTDAPELGTGFIYFGMAQGGVGGTIRINATQFQGFINTSSGIINAGYGGDARGPLSSCSGAITGQGGKVEIIPLDGSGFLNEGTVGGGENGTVYVEPEIILVGANTRIKDAKEIIIFTGDNSKLTLGNLSTNAIVAQERIVVATGADGIIDLRGGTSGMFNAPTVEFYTDNLLKDEGIDLKDLVSTDSSVEQQTARIIYAVSLSGTGTIQAEPGAIVSTPIKITNIGPYEDSYQLTAEDLQGWSLSLPASISVEGLHSKSFQLDITLPATAAIKNTIKIVATSQRPESGAQTQKLIEATVLTSPQYCCSYQTELGGKFCSVTDITFEQCRQSAKSTGAKVFQFGTGTCFDNTCAGTDVQEYLKAKLASFKATAFQNSVRLDWQSLSEENEAYFVVYRGIPINGKCDQNLDNYKDIKEVARVNAQGNLIEGATYTALDKLPKEGKDFCYLLESRELDGQKDRHWELLQSIAR